MTAEVAYLSQGKLFFKRGDEPAQELESQFGQTVQDRILQIKRRNSWKEQNTMANFFPPEILREIERQAENPPPIAITSLCQGQANELFYALAVGDVGGIFKLNRATQREDRLFHSNDFQVYHLDLSPDGQQIACTTVYRTGVANIALMSVDGIRPRDVTEGDSVDLAPRWVEGQGRAIVFQSAGLGRDRNGLPVEQAPFTIERLDFERQTLDTLVEDPKCDLLGPQLLADGTLYYISRPYQLRQRPVGILPLLKDIVLAPVRLIYAIFQWLNFFTRRYTGKPMTIAGMPANAEAKRLVEVWGSLIDPDKAFQANRRFGDVDAPSLVPRTWQLMRKVGTAPPTAIAESVLAFDVQPDGTVVYTNGSGVYLLAPGAVPRRLFVGDLLEQVHFLH